MNQLAPVSGNSAMSGSASGGDKIPLSKRVLDVLCLAVAFPAWMLIMAGVSAFIFLVSPGPVFFVQDRAGHRGRRFRCFKFRTMKLNASTQSHQEHLKQLMKSDAPMTKLDAKGDPRLIPFGAFLRASGLDELPQLLNVFLGQMSLVGPRPCTLFEYEQYEPWQRERFNALPGLTGLWQVSGKNRTTFREMVRLDIAYARSHSVPLDLGIIAKTFGVLSRQIREVFSHRPEDGPTATPANMDRVPVPVTAFGHQTFNVIVAPKSDARRNRKRHPGTAPAKAPRAAPDAGRAALVSRAG